MAVGVELGWLWCRDSMGEVREFLTGGVGVVKGLALKQSHKQID